MRAPLEKQPESPEHAQLALTRGVNTLFAGRPRDALVELERAASVLGTYVPGCEPRRMPAGTSLHYMGTVRMGDDGGEASVCDGFSRVWGFSNLFVGGNGVIPTANACNPTLTSVALAARAIPRLLEVLER
jgi:choline dehydrogenase-like flavoprotein